MDSFLIYVDYCSPRANLTVTDKADSDESAFVVFVTAVVFHILDMLASAKVFAAIIKCVSVCVVPLIAGGAVKKYAMHSDHAVLTCAALGIERTCSFAPMCTPIPLRRPFKVGGIYESILSLCQRDQSIGLVFWLGNEVPLHSAFRHESSFKGLVLPGHFNMID